MSTNVTPWWKALKLRDEIVDASGAIDDVQMSLHDSVYGSGVSRPEYAEVGYFGEITHPTGQLVDLLAKLAVRTGGGDDHVSAPALIRLDQGMGGGKSHACIGAWHLAEHPAEFAKTDVGREVHQRAATILGRDLPANLNSPRVVVLACDSMTPGATVQETDGPGKNLWERFLWRLFDRDYARWEQYQPFFNDKSKVVDALRSVGRPVLIIVDEILNYVGNGLDGAGDDKLTGQDMGFLRVLFDAVNDVPNCAMLVVMIASERDTIALSAAGARRRDELSSLLDRNGRPATVNENADFAAILRRRLFDQPPAKEVVDATVAAFEGVMRDKGWKSKVLDVLNLPWTKDFADQVARSYPFHPQLMHVAETEWANLAGFQKVRSTIRVFAATVWALQRRGKADGWVPLLIGPGDLPLSDTTVRESVLGSGLIGDTKTQANYRSLAQNDIVSLDDTTGTARMLDREREPGLWDKANPRAAERAATAVFLASIVGARGQGRRGASEPEVKSATLVPTLNYALADADGLIRDLTDGDTGLAAVETIAGKGGTPPRYFLSTKQTLSMLHRATRSTISDEDRDQILAGTAERLATTGPFRKKVFVRAEKGKTGIETLAAAGLDDARTTRLVVLDPAGFSLRNGMEEETLESLNAAIGLGPDRITSSWASSCVFAVVNTQRRAHARQIASEYLAWDRVLDTTEVQSDESLRDKAKAEVAEARRRLETAVQRAYQHVTFLSQPDPDQDRELGQITFDDDSQSSLNGALVWKALVQVDKAFDQGQFTKKALLHQLRESDYGRPLNEIRDAFWQSPRLPLLHEGEAELRHAIYDAVTAGDLRVVSRDGSAVAVTGPNEINLQSATLTLSKPASEKPAPVTETDPESLDHPAPGPSPSSRPPGGGTTDPGPDPDKGPGPAPAKSEQEADQDVTLSIMRRFAEGDDEAIDSTAAMLRLIYEAIEAGGASYMQGQLRLIARESWAEQIAEAAKSAQITATVRDV